MTQLTTILPESEDSIPPFQSATNFPVNPKQERLAQLYPNALQALKNANVARRALRSSLEKKKQMIIEIRTEIDRIESDLALEAETRFQLHTMNKQLIKALQEIEGVADEISNVVLNAHQTPRTRLGVLIERLKNLVKHWRALKLRFRQDLSSSGEE